MDNPWFESRPARRNAHAPIWTRSTGHLGQTGSCPRDTLGIASETSVECVKEAGLGNETQVHIEVTATAECINNGGKHPKAVNKESVSAAGDFPVQNGKAEFSLTLTASFQPECSPPMTVRFSDVVVSDTEHNISTSLGTL